MSIFSRNKETGAYGERLAVKFLKKNGYRILERNYATRHGEIDIIAKNKGTLVFAEVKTRTETEALKRFGRPGYAVNEEKRKHIVYAAKHYMKNMNIKLAPRIDIIEVYLSPDDPKIYRIEHFKGSFGG